MLWLAAFVMRGMGPVAPPISMRARTVMLSYGAWVICIWIVYTRLGSVDIVDEAAEPCVSTIGSPATSLSITDHTAELHLMTPLLIPLTDTVYIQSDPTLLLQLAQAYQGFLPPQPPVPAVDPPVLSREGGAV